jgi:Protein of unknown function (DUF1569)
MTKTMFGAAARQELQGRLARLAPDRVPRWGKLNAPRMVAHLADSLKMALGELDVAPKKTPLRLPVLKQLVIYLLPWPKGTPTAPELLRRAPAAWNGEVVGLSELIERFATRSVRDAWPPHPAFGTMSGRDWGALVYKHCDHHFRQFGV